MQWLNVFATFLNKDWLIILVQNAFFPNIYFALFSSSVKQNILAFVAELFFLMELEPVSCVSVANTKRSSSAKYIQLASPGNLMIILLHHLFTKDFSLF